ncbi:hypothetical protein Fmac_005693 [Flemingia macrophylla]|uniref:Uncharacterized protein n=1 Tax=Flemingia macrophylla TaxID=520843 RepID=A0ABD1N8W2_9FABA
MPPKKRKAEGETSIDGEQHIYRSMDHALHSVKVEKISLLMERELKLGSDEYPDFMKELRRRNWEKIV